MQEKLMEIKENALKSLEEANSTSSLDEVRVKYLVKRRINYYFKIYGWLIKGRETYSREKLVNEIKAELEAKIEEVAKAIKEKERKQN